MLDEPSLGLAPILVDQVLDTIQSLRRPKLNFTNWLNTRLTADTLPPGALNSNPVMPADLEWDDWAKTGFTGYVNHLDAVRPVQTRVTAYHC